MTPFYNEELKVFSLLPLIAIVAPGIGAVVVTMAGKYSEKLRDRLAFLTAILTLVVVLTILIKTLQGNSLYFESGLIRISREHSLKLAVDSMGALFAFITSLMWVAALAHATSYMLHEEKRTRFFSLMMLIEASTLGVFLTRDFFSLFIFFEIMGLLGYFFVVHSETEAAHRAAGKYLFMTIIGGLSLLMGILLYYDAAETTSFIPLAGSAFLTGSLKTVSLCFLIAGFGVKAGMMPLHIWLPDAHPAAPSPASALLSGVMIKAGAYGILRVITSFSYSSANHDIAYGMTQAVIRVSAQATEAATNTVSSLSQNIQVLGFVLIWIAAFSMVAGMVLAVVQSDIKRTLAYSSISQMGFILLGAGCLAYLGEKGAVGLAGSLYHIVNHAFFKSCLFLVAGSIIYRTHQTNMLSLGGLWRKMPISTVLWCVAALGIMGIPLLNGFASKTLLHHAIVEAGHLANESTSVFAPWLKIAETVFVIASADTVLYFLKMTYYIFFRAKKAKAPHLEEVREVPLWMLGGSAMLVVGVIVVGLAPSLFLRQLIIPVLEMFRSLDPHDIEHLSELSILSLPNVREALLPLLLGLGAFAVGLRLGFFENGIKLLGFSLPKMPVWLSFDYCYIGVAKRFIAFCFLVQRLCQKIESDTVSIVRGVLIFLHFQSRKVRARRHLLSLKRYLDELKEGFTRVVEAGKGEIRTAESNFIILLSATTNKLENILNIYLDEMTLGVLVITICLTLLMVYILL